MSVMGCKTKIRKFYLETQKIFSHSPGDLGSNPLAGTFSYMYTMSVQVGFASFLLVVEKQLEKCRSCKSFPKILEAPPKRTFLLFCSEVLDKVMLQTYLQMMGKKSMALVVFQSRGLTRNYDCSSDKKSAKMDDLNGLWDWNNNYCWFLKIATAFLQEGDAGRPNTVYCKNRGFFQGQEDANSGYKDGKSV